ncbi:MAG: hypothetical protein MAG431_02561 [Chloroflexi bacterium]|nr:hypothetical protein [Chloroflexota bacterium]
MEVLKSLLTILILVLLGIASRKANIFAKEHVKTLSSFVYYFALPALFFVELMNLDLFSLDYHVIVGTLLPILVVLLVLFALKALGWIAKDQFILLSLVMSLGSYAFFGVAFFETLHGGKWLEETIVSASGLGVMGILLTILLFEYANKKEKGLGFLRKIFTNPLILAIFFGLVFSALGLRVKILNDSLSLLGRAAGGIAIFSLGIFIYDNFSTRAIKKALFYSLFRALLLPLATLAIIFLTPSQSADLNQFLLLQSGIPSAVSLVVFAERYEYKIAEVAGIVILTSLLSFFGLTGLFYLSQFIF